MLQQPVLIPFTDKTFKLAQSFIYYYQWNKRHFRIIVPQDFETDLASVPRWVWSLFNILPFGLHAAAAVIHDWLYKHQGFIPVLQEHIDGKWVDINYIFSREECDKMFAHIMREARVAPWKRRSMYLAVRVFGVFYWSK